MLASQIRKAADLLRPGETVPEAVLRSERFLGASGVWYRLARNSEATSCRDAAARRERLGAASIPLWDEMKTLVFESAEELVFAHCRGDEEVNTDALASATSSQLRPAGEDALDRYGLGYGLVNPFSVWERGSGAPAMVHVVDRGLMSPLGVPGTMMTNAGDRFWAVEFNGPDLLKLIPEAIVADIAARPVDRPRWAIDSRPIGIVTGNGPESGMKLLEFTLAEVRSRLERENRGDVSLPALQVASVPAMGFSMELSERAEATLLAVTDAVEKLCSDGCGIVAVACNTTQFFGPELREICDSHAASFLSMPEVVADWLSSQGVQTIGLVGIKYVSDLAEWSAYRPAFAGRFEVETPSSWGMERIEELAYRVKAEGVTSRTEPQFANLLRDVVDAEFTSNYVVVALTELSLLLERMSSRARNKREAVLIDPLKLYGQALACNYLGLRFPSLSEESR